MPTGKRPCSLRAKAAPTDPPGPYPTPPPPSGRPQDARDYYGWTVLPTRVAPDAPQLTTVTSEVMVVKPSKNRLLSMRRLV